MHSFRNCFFCKSQRGLSIFDIFPYFNLQIENQYFVLLIAPSPHYLPNNLHNIQNYSLKLKKKNQQK